MIRAARGGARGKEEDPGLGKEVRVGFVGSGAPNRDQGVEKGATSIFWLVTFQSGCFFGIVEQ